jgi:hypothetical protein
VAVRTSDEARRIPNQVVLGARLGIAVQEPDADVAVVHRWPRRIEFEGAETVDDDHATVCHGVTLANRLRERR